MQQQIPIQPLRVEVKPKNKSNKKIKKNGCVTAYKCRFCQYQSFNLGYSRKHILCCTRRNEIRENIQRKNIFQQKFIKYHQQMEEQIMQQNPIAQKSKSVQVIDKMRQLEERLSAIQNDPAYKKQIPKSEKAKKLASDIIEQIQSLLLGNLRLELSKNILGWLQSQINVEAMKFEICTKLIQKAQQIHLADLIDSFQRNLQKYHLELQKRFRPKVADKTWIRVKSGYRFLKQYSQINMIHQHKLVSDLINETKYVRLNAIKYYNKMISEYSDVFPYKRLPKRLKTYDESLPKPIRYIDLDMVKKQVIKLVDQEQYIMATDLWAITTLGYRKSQLLKMNFQNSEGIFASAIKIFQKKNRLETIRIIPNSLKFMIKRFSVEYPMDQSRLEVVRNHSLSNFGRFYGLRHVCITSLMTALYQNSTLARVHKNQKTTTKFYLDHNSRMFVNKVFSLDGFQDDDKFQRQQHAYLLVVGNNYGEQIFEKIEEINRIELVPPNQTNQESFQLAQKDSLIISSNKQMENFINNDEEDIKIKKIMQRYILKKFNKEIEEKQYDCLLDLLQEISGDSNFEQNLNQYCESIGSLISNQSIISFSKKIYELAICFLRFSAKKITPEYVQNNQFTKSMVIIAQTKSSTEKKYHQAPEDKPQRVRLPRKAKKNKSYSQRPSPQLKMFSPLCIQCRPSRKPLNIEICKSCKKGLLQCQNCKSSQHQCQTNIINYAQQIIYFRAEGIATDIYFKSVVGSDQDNNIQETIKQKGKCHRKLSLLYYEDLPRQIRTRYPIFSDMMSQQIYYNRINQTILPLKIEESQGKGLGVFSTKDIEQNLLICSYLGILGSEKSINLNSDSCFFLGWITEQNQHPMALFIEAQYQFNVGRFLNSSDNESEANCGCLYGLLNISSNMMREQYEIAVIIYSKKYIKAGDQLLWFYGKQYWKNQ